MIKGGVNLLKCFLKSSQPESLHSGLETRITKVEIFQGRREAVHLTKAIMSGAEENHLLERSFICWFVLVILQEFGCLWIFTEQCSKFPWTWLVIGFTCALSLSAERKAHWHHEFV